MFCFDCKSQNLDFFALEAYHSLISSLNSEFPGKGIDFFNNDTLNRPAAYGLILSSETNRYKYTNSKNALIRARQCGNWLLQNSDLNNDGVYGYGLADSWDAFQDSTINPPFTEYTITNSLVINGLIDWLLIEKNILKRIKIKDCIKKVLNPYLTNKFKSSILKIPVYSGHLYDSEYDVYNTAFQIGGQMQKYSTYVNNRIFKKNLFDESNRIYEILIEQHKIDVKKNIYWNYGLQINRPNDLVHALLIIEGIRNYKHYKRLNNIKFEKIFNHINLFYIKNQWKNNFSGNKKIRLWSLGMLIYSLSKEKKFLEVQSVLPQVYSFYNQSKKSFCIENKKCLIREKSFLLYGLSHYLFNDEKIILKK